MKKNPGTRIRIAYWTAFSVAMSYVRLSFVRRFRGKRWYDEQLPLLHLRNAARVRDTILDLQGLFIKVGQLLSVMSNFLPPAFQQPLEALQDRLPAQPYESVKKRIEEELGRPPEQLFRSFNAEPMATASIGQAHRATLEDGTEVVVKVQHYGIEAIAQTDLYIIQRLIRVYSWFMEIQGMDYLYAQIRQMIEEELDFKNEARALETIRHNLADEVEVQLPELFAQYSTGRVMTTRFCVGAKIGDTAQLDAWQVDRRSLAARAVRIWCRMIFKDGFYHADPHPGNLLVTPKGHLILLDFGATARLSAGLRNGIPQLIECTVRNDSEGMIDACRSMGFLADGPDAERLARKMIASLRRFLQEEIQMEGLDFKTLRFNPLNNSLTDLIQDIGFRGISGAIQVPKDYVLLNRTVTLLLGICNTLEPAYNPLDTIRPFAQQYLLQDKGGPLGYMRDMLQRTLTNTLALPDEIQRTLRKTRAGEIAVQVPDVEAGTRRIAVAIRKLTFALLGIGGAFFSLQLQQAGHKEAGIWGLRIAGFLTVLALWPSRSKKN
jgi:predicted unusual protein kinase regulating ubiquinone biosynthesis (AarF/ABC1/UbiB family)